MNLVKAILRPIYKAFFERPLWWFLFRVKSYFFAETLQRLDVIEARLAALESMPRYDERFNHLEAHSAAQWDAMEQLLLAMLNQPRIEPDREIGIEQESDFAVTPNQPS